MMQFEILLTMIRHWARSKREPMTPTIPRQRVHPASDPPQAPPILPQTFHSSPENVSEGDTTDSPSKVVDRIHRSLGIRTVPERPRWHPLPRSREFPEKKNEMWPIVGKRIREELNTYRRILQQNPRKLNMGDFGIMLAMYGSSRTTARPSFIILSPERLPPTMIPRRDSRTSLDSFLYDIPTPEERSEDVLLKGYTYPGLAIGAAERPHTSFSLGG